MMECEKISQHGEISESSKTSKNQTDYIHTWTFFQIIESSRKQKYKHENTLFCIQICTPKHERAENPFSENHALSPPHFRKFDYFFDCCRHIPKIIPKFGMQNLSNTIGPLVFVLKRIDWISFILTKRCVRFYYCGVPCLSLSTSNHSLAPFLLRISVVVGTRFWTQQCIRLHFNTTFIVPPLLCCFRQSWTNSLKSLNYFQKLYRHQEDYDFSFNMMLDDLITITHDYKQL